LTKVVAGSGSLKTQPRRKGSVGKRHELGSKEKRCKTWGYRRCWRKGSNEVEKWVSGR